MLVSKPRAMWIKTPLAREFEKDLTDRLLEYKDAFTKFRSSFNPTEHYISAEYYIFTPENLLLTKDKRISSRSPDSDSYKLFRDVLYKSIGLDDKLERSTFHLTPISQDEFYNYVVILKLEKICNLSSCGLTLSSAIPQKEILDPYALL